MSPVRAVCPGKIILMGEHAAVYGRPAVVATVGLTTEVVFESDAGKGVVADLVDLNQVFHWSSQEIIDHAEQARRRWNAYAAAPSAQRLHRLMAGGGAERFVQLALGEAVRATGSAPNGLRMTLSSELPLGAGMGSSASVASAIVGAWLGFVGEPMDLERISSVVLEVERRQHGFPSGIDHEAVLRGGILWAQPSAEYGRVEVESLTKGSQIQPTILDTGVPEQSTGTVVETVRENTGGASYAGWDRMAVATTEFRRLLESGGDVGPLVRLYHREMEQIGVVPDPVADWVSSWEDQAGAAKLSGAGTARGERAGCLLAYSAGADPVVPASWRRHDATISVPGLQVESV